MHVATAGQLHREAHATPFPKALLRAATRKMFSVALLCTSIAISLSQVAPPSAIDDQSLRKYVGTYEWGPNHLVYLQTWSEFTGKNDLVAFDDCGEVRTLFPAEGGRFVTGPGAGIPDPVESRIEFSRDASGRIVSLSWQRGNSGVRTAHRDPLRMAKLRQVLTQVWREQAQITTSPSSCCTNAGLGECLGSCPAGSSVKLPSPQ